MTERSPRYVASEGERSTEAAWAETERREAYRRRGEARQGWIEWHSHLSEQHAASVEALGGDAA